MAAILILSLALFSGAASAFKLHDVVIASNGTSNATTTLQQFPSVVQVESYSSSGWGGWGQVCAASILNEVHVLTAASCFSGPAHHRRIRAGASIRNAGGVIVYVDRATNYQQNTTNSTVFHDISVVRLSSGLIFSSLIRQAAILRQGSVIPRELQLSQVGWGYRKQKKTSQHTMAKWNELSETFVNTFPGVTNQTLPSNVTSNIITAYPRFSVNSNGDVGGPWIWGTITVGVIPANNLFLNGSSIFATTVSAYTDWMLRVVG